VAYRGDNGGGINNGGENIQRHRIISEISYLISYGANQWHQYLAHQLNVANSNAMAAGNVANIDEKRSENGVPWRRNGNISG
jgi:hypothetical protein